jgi:hypothetical protein
MKDLGIKALGLCSISLTVVLFTSWSAEDGLESGLNSGVVYLFVSVLIELTSPLPDTKSERFRISNSDLNIALIASVYAFWGDGQPIHRSLAAIPITLCLLFLWKPKSFK